LAPPIPHHQSSGERSRSPILLVKSRWCARARVAREPCTHQGRIQNNACVAEHSRLARKSIPLAKHHGMRLLEEHWWWWAGTWRLRDTLPTESLGTELQYLGLVALVLELVQPRNDLAIGSNKGSSTWQGQAFF
jgi:hypothetical protein